ncbi:MAG: PQQ-binding-like beta-propeller repeat protein [Planctomycetia bacterium]|nr:PQQ-binding-like beta-propeller repeat protein [Planctomycetia bacterium]
MWFLPAHCRRSRRTARNSCAGCVFKAFGHVGYKERDWPWLNTLVAINGYNGTMLWKRPLEPGFNIHRNTMIATAEVLYVGDSKSCKLIDTATGKLKDEITAPEGSTGPVWKWMALRDGVLYAIVGEEEFRDETLRGNRTDAGWPWRPMTAGYDAKEYPWGFGRTLFAMDLKTRKVLWLDNEEKPIDARAVAMTGNRIIYYCHPNFLACRDAGEGKVLWRNADQDLLEAIGPHHRAQEPSTGFSSQVYMVASDKAVYFAGPQRTRLVAASTENGKLLWQYPHGNFGLVLRDEGLFAMGRTGPSKLFEPLTGKIIADIECLRGNCTRATGTVDSVFARGHEHSGTVRIGAADLKFERMALMRPDCHDGVIVANGLLYWGPWMCDCSLSLVGIICMGPAGDFAFNAEAVESERLERFEQSAGTPSALPVAAGDWPAYRADNRRSAASRVRVPNEVTLAWQYQPPTARDPAAPITAGGLVFASGADGVVRALDAADGKCRWKAYTAGAITFPPAVSENRLLVGSGDGCVYAFAAADGKPLWRFRAAPAERKIPVHGRLSSTWPVASGVLVDKGTVYAAAGIASYDGTHVYALDSATGGIRWQNNTSGRLANSDHVTGVSVQGHLLLHEDRLYLAGGNVVSPAVFDTKDGRCLNGPVNEWAKAPRGRELFVVDNKVVAFDRLLYGPKDYWVGRYFARRLIQADSPETNTLIRGVDDRVVRVVPGAKDEKELAAAWTTRRFKSPVAMAIGDNAVVIAGTTPEGENMIAALAMDDGRWLWSQALPGMPIQGGLALDAAGRIVVGLEDGRYLCFVRK